MTALGEMIVNLTDPQAAAAEVSQLNMRLSRSERIPESVASDIDEIARSISETDYRHWDATAPELAPLALTAVLSATQAVAHRDEDWAREELRLALGQLSYALARIAEGDPISPERSPKEIARWLAESAEVPQREIAELLGVPLRTFQRWLSEREPTAPDGDEATRLRVLAALFTQLRHVFTPAGTLRWLTTPNGHLEGRAPQELLADGEALPKLLGIARGLRDQPAAQVPLATCYRGVSYQESLWKTPNPDGARYNYPGEAPTQYLSLHPLGPWAELLRWARLSRPDTEALVRGGGFRRRTWALRVDLDGLPRIGFADASVFGVDPQALIDDDYADSRAWATTMRGSHEGMICPSAALPGTECVVLFGPRFETDFPQTPLGPNDIPTSVTADDATMMSSLLPLVRLYGERHQAYQAFVAGHVFDYVEPSFV